MTTLDIARHATPLGGVQTALHDGVLCALALDDALAAASRGARAALRELRDAHPERRGSAHVTRALDAYFAGDTGALDDLAVDPGGTPFQRAVWGALRAVPAGETVSYGALARAIGRPDAARAVGAACGANPIWLVVPCHRAIGIGRPPGRLRGGLERKRWLLAHERRARGGRSLRDRR